MLRIQMMGLAIVAALTMGAVAAVTASAEEFLHQWLISGHLLAAPVRVHLSELLLLEDSKATGGAAEIHCHRYGTGTVGPHGLDLTESITLELLGTKKLVSCSFDKVGACKSGTEPVVEAIHLPWRTQLVLNSSGRVRDLPLAHGNGRPGWAVTCTNILGGKTTDTCEEEEGRPGSVSMRNIPTAAMGVEETFDSETRLLGCSIGGKEAGRVSGTGLIESPSATEPLLFD